MTAKPWSALWPLAERLRRVQPRSRFAASWGLLTSRAARAVPTFEATHVEPGSSRTYAVVTRRDHDPRRAAPVLFALHAYGTAPDVLVRSYSLVEHAVSGLGWVLVVPEGKPDDTGRICWNATVACCGAGSSGTDDLGYLQGVLGSVRQHHSVDSERVYAIGVSNGGFMAHRWACAARGEVRAIASVSGVGLGPDDRPCAPTVPVSVLQIHGTADDVILYEGTLRPRGRMPSVRDTVESWRRVAGAPAEPRTEERRSVLFGRTRVETWQGPRARVALWSIEEGGHYLRFSRGVVPEMLDFLSGR